jgi:phage FluMu protein Com
MLVRPLKPGPELSPGTTMDCRACGRKLLLDGMHLKDKVRCRGCGRINWITEKHLAFRYTEKIRERQRAGLRLGYLIVFGLCVLAVVRMASRHGQILLSCESLNLLGLSALWIALLIHAICYGVGAGLGVVMVLLMRWVNGLTRELGIFGAVMCIFSGLGRMVLYFLGRQVGSTFISSFPYGLVLWGLFSTAGSVWRARMFPQR